MPVRCHRTLTTIFKSPAVIRNQWKLEKDRQGRNAHTSTCVRKVEVSDRWFGISVYVGPMKGVETKNSCLDVLRQVFQREMCGDHHTGCFGSNSPANLSVVTMWMASQDGESSWRRWLSSCCANVT